MNNSNEKSRVPFKAVIVSGFVGVLGLVSYGTAEQAAAQLPQILTARSMLRYDRPEYNNYAYNKYSNYLHHTLPQGSHLAWQYAQKTFYDQMGNKVMTGFDLYNWSEQRQANQKWGSTIQIDEGT